MTLRYLMQALRRFAKLPPSPKPDPPSLWPPVTVTRTKSAERGVDNAVVEPAQKDVITTRAKSAKRGSLQWIPEGVPINVAGHSIRGGMVYFGRGAPAANGYGVEPALIDPSLKVNWQRPDWMGRDMSYWGSYERITPACRAAYLSWLSSDRDDPGTYIGYVFLYFYGLERRLLHDVKVDIHHADAPLIATEVKRLLTIYGANDSFRSYASSLLDLIDSVSTVQAPLSPPDPASLQQSWEVPFGIRMGLGRYVAAGQAIPADWALALLRTHPESYLRTPATRCSAEFDELFRHRYRRKFNDGMVVRPPKATVVMSYRPASSGFAGHYQARLSEVPDITKIKGPINEIRELAVECTDALDAYSRYLGRKPDAVGGAEAAGMLPDELLETHGGPTVTALREWATQLVAGGEPVTITIDDIVARWSPGRTTKLAKVDAVSFAGLLAKLGVGIEPDVRFGSSTPAPGSAVVVFPLPAGSTSSPSSRYGAAAMLVHFTAVVASVDGSVTENERRRLASHLEDVLGLDAAERLRLEAHLAWLVAANTNLKGLKKRVDSLNPHQRADVGRFLIDVAAADGVVTPEEITTLTKIYKLLGLEEAEVYREIHALGTSDAGPVTVRTSQDTEPRWTVPAPARKRNAPVRLDPVKVQARLADTATVTAMLTDIFTDDTEDSVQPGSSNDPFPVVAAATMSNVDGIGGIDVAHSTLADRLLSRSAWSRVEAEDLATTLGLPMLDGAIDRINEAVIEVCGEPLVDGDDPLEINDYAAKELI